MASRAQRLEFDVMTDILSRLPVKSLLRFKCVSREWRDLISSPYFTSLHLKRAISNPLRQSMLVHRADDSVLMLVDTVKFTPYTCDINTFSFGKPMRFVGSRNGVLCVCGPSGKWVCLWNPATRMLREIETGITHVKSFKSMGFGFDPIANDYKIVLFYSRDTDEEEVGNMGLKVWSTKLESWKEIEVDLKLGTPNFICHVTVNEFAYWIVVNDELETDLLASFNMSTEILRLYSIPHNYGDYKDHGYHGFILNDKFAFMTFDHYERERKTWTLENESDFENSYWKEIRLEFVSYAIFTGHLPINFGTGKFMHYRTTKQLYIYDPETRKKNATETIGHANWFDLAHSYVQSLISINGFAPQ